MTILNITLLVILVIICLPMYFLLILYGYIFLKQNNLWGLLLLFITLNLIGLTAGFIILFNNNFERKEYKFKKYKFLNKFLIDEKKIAKS